MNVECPQQQCANIDYNDGTDATYSTGATQVQTPSSANDAAAEWKRKYELLLAAQQATLASTPAPVISAPIAVTATKPKKTPKSGAKMAAISGRLTLQKIQII